MGGQWGLLPHMIRIYEMPWPEVITYGGINLPIIFIVSKWYLLSTPHNGILPIIVLAKEALTIVIIGLVVHRRRVFTKMRCTG